MVNTIKFSEFANGGDLSNDKITVGLDSGLTVNTRYNNPWTFLAPGTTGDRPAPDPSIYYRLRVNTTLQVYEYYDPITAMWVELSGSGTGTVNPGTTNSVAYYASNGTTVSPTNSVNNAVLVTDNTGLPSFNTTLPAGLIIPGYEPTITPQPLTKTNDTNVTLTLGGTPATSLLQPVSLTLGWTGQLGITRGGTGVSSVTTSPTATAFAGWDSHKNFSANSFIVGYTTTATSGGTTTLTVDDTQQQYFTGSTTHTLVLPVVSTLVLGQTFLVVNNSTGDVTVQSSGLNDIQIMSSNTNAIYTVISTSGTTAASWDTNYTFDAVGVTSITGTANQVIASAPVGNVILSLPQSIATTSSPTFSNLTLSNPLGVADGGTGLSTITAQQLLYGQSTGIIGQLSSGNNSILVTDGSGNPFFSTTLPSGISITGHPLTKVDDTNVTLTLGGNPSTALLQATSITAGWTGTLSGARGGTGVANTGLTIDLSSATAGYVLTADAFGNATWQIASGTGSVTTIDGDTGSATPTLGVVTISGAGTGLTTSGSGSTLSLGGVLSLANGGTNHNLLANAGGIVWSDASKLNILAGTSTANQLLLSGNAATPVWSTSTYPTTNAINTLLYASSANTMAALATAIDGVLITSHTGVPSWLANSGTPGFVLTANSGAPPSWQSASASGAITTINGDSGSATPTAGAVTVSGGTTGLTTSGSSSTLNLTGTLKLINGGTNAALTASNGGIFYSTATAGAILSGTATANQVLLSGSSTAPAWSTATYPATTTINQVLYSSSANVIAGISSVNNAVMITSAGGVPSFATTLPSGLTIPGYQTTITPAALTKTDDTNVTLTLGGTPASALLAATSITAGWTGTLAVSRGGIGSGSATAYAVICGGTTSTGALQSVASVGTSGQVLTSNGAGALPTFQALGSGSVVNQNSSSVTMTSNTGYLINNGASLVTLTLPTSSAIGDYIDILGFSSGGWTIAQASGQLIHIGNQVTTTGATGSLASSNQYDCVRLRCLVANTTWTVSSMQSAGLTYV